MGDLMATKDTWKILDQDGDLRAEFPAELGNQVLENLVELYENLGYDNLIQAIGKAKNE